MSASTMSRPVVHLALELSVTSWVIAYRLPWSDKVRLLRVSAGDGAALLALVSDLREKVAARTGQDATLASCFEAGRDGFWLHRLLTDNGVVNHVVEDLKLPPNITLVHLPPYAPELNPMENVWEYLRGNQRHHRLPLLRGHSRHRL